MKLVAAALSVATPLAATHGLTARVFVDNASIYIELLRGKRTVSCVPIPIAELELEGMPGSFLALVFDEVHKLLAMEHRGSS